MTARYDWPMRWAGPVLVLVLTGVAVGSADDRTRSLLLNTLGLAAGTCALSVPLGTLVALAVTKTDLPGRRLATLLLAVALFVPLYLQAAAWQAGFGLGGWFTLATGTGPLLAGWRGSLWVHAVAAFPWVVLIVALGLLLVEREFEDQALLDAAAAKVFLRVTLRRAVKPVVVAMIWVAVTVAGEMTVTDLFQVRTYAEEIYTEFAVAPALDQPPLAFWPGPATTGLLVLAALVACRELAPGLGEPSLSAVWRYRLGRWRAAAALSVHGIVLAAVGLPVANLAYKAAIQVRPVGAGYVRTWSAVKLATVVLSSPIRYGREMGWSLGIAVLAALAAVVVAIWLAWWARTRRAGSWCLLVVASCGLAIPGPVVGIATIWLLNRPSQPWLLWLYDNSIFAPWLAQTLRALPLPLLILWHAFATLPQATIDAAAIEGAGPARRLLGIVLPMRLAAVGLAWLAAFVAAFGELSATVLVAPPGMPTLPLRIFNLLHYGVEDRVAGICLAVLAIIAGIVAGVWGVGRLRVQSRESRVES